MNGLLVKTFYETNPALGKPPEKRGLKELIETGVIPLDKPPSVTSTQVSMWIKKLFSLSKIGHAGTLEF